MYHGKQVILRALEMDDLEHIVPFQNRWELRRWAGVPLPKSRHVIEDWLRNVSCADPWRDGVLYLAITARETGEFVGIVRLYDIKSPHLRAAIGIAIHESEKRSMGYGTDATRVMLWVAFNVLGLHSVYLDTMEHNERAIHVAEKVGFKRVGMFRETEFIDGEYKGLIYFDILSREFFDMFPRGTPIGT